MSDRFESVVPTLPNCQFPGGDVLSRNVEQAQTIFATLQGGTREEQRQRIKVLRQTELLTWEALQSQATTRKNLRNLYTAWGTTLSNHEYGRAIAAVGADATLAFIHKSHLLPTKYPDFSTTLAEMQEYDTPTIRFFANEAWAGMEQSHPKAHSVLAPLVEHLAEINDISPHHEEEYTLLRASAALPYLMATTTRMEAYLPREFGGNNPWAIIERMDNAPAS